MSATTTKIDPGATAGDQRARGFAVGGREGRARAAAITRWVFLAIVVVILYGPLLILALFSLNDSIVIALPFKGFTLEWYRLGAPEPAGACEAKDLPRGRAGGHPGRVDPGDDGGVRDHAVPLQGPG